MFCSKCGRIIGDNMSFFAVFVWSIIEAIMFFIGKGTDKYGKVLIKK